MATRLRSAHQRYARLYLVDNLPFHAAISQAVPRLAVTHSKAIGRGCFRLQADALAFLRVREGANGATVSLRVKRSGLQLTRQHKAPQTSSQRHESQPPLVKITFHSTTIMMD